MKEEMLKYGYSEKIEEEAVELLLTSIQAKMGIIDITKERDGVTSWAFTLFINQLLIDFFIYHSLNDLLLHLITLNLSQLW